MTRLHIEALEDRALPSLNYTGSFPRGGSAPGPGDGRFHNDGHLDPAMASYYDGDVRVLQQRRPSRAGDRPGMDRD